MTDADLVLDLCAVSRDDVERVGGKAANLGELIRAGFCVPPGFCVTTNAYAQAFEALDLDELVEAERADQVRQRFASATLPEGLRQQIVEAYKELGAPVAVRSSATAEDLPDASFAGQHDTYLNVVGVDAVLDAVRRCWGSLWTPRAVVYRARNGIDHRGVRLAVVIQAMVDARSSGVLYTANPVTGCRKEVVVDASTGLGESVVSGAVNPDHFVLRTDTGELVERTIGDKRTAVRARAAGGTTTVPNRWPGKSALTDTEAFSLARIGRRIERHYGVPQDIEWAVDGDGRYWVTQARPMTTLFPLPRADGSDLRVYVSANVTQGIYRPLTPMGIDVIGLVSESMMGDAGRIRESLATVDGWMLLDATALVRSRFGRALARRLFAVGEARTAAVLASLQHDRRLAGRRKGPKPPRPPIMQMFGQVRSLAGIVGTLRDPAGARDEAFRQTDDLQRALAATPITTGPQAIESTRAAFMRHAGQTITPMLPTVMAILMLHRLAPLVLGRAATPEEFQRVLRGMPYNITTEMDLRLWHLTDAVRSDQEASELFSALPPDELAARYWRGELPERLRSGVEGFLARYGHRAVTEIDAGVPRWSEQPEYLIGALANYLLLDDPALAPPQLFARNASDAEATAARIVRRLRERSPLRAGIAAFVLDRLRQLSGLRELPKYCYVLGVAHARAQLRALGEQLVANGRLDAADDVFFLDLEEAAAADSTDHRPTVTQRRAAYARELRRGHVPRVLLSDGTEPETTLAAPPAEGMLTGAPAAPGTVTGTVRVVRDPAGARIEPGEILVTPSTDPGWTPLFLTAGGLVMEMGGSASHGATVAREYGIPAVVGVPDATSLIAPGQRVTVDGSAGTVAPEDA